MSYGRSLHALCSAGSPVGGLKRGSLQESLEQGCWIPCSQAQGNFQGIFGHQQQALEALGAMPTSRIGTLEAKTSQEFTQLVKLNTSSSIKFALYLVTTLKLELTPRLCSRCFHVPSIRNNRSKNRTWRAELKPGFLP